MRPSKSVMDFNVKSLKKKFKDKRFAAGVNRDVIRRGADMLGWELDELFERTMPPCSRSRPIAIRLQRRSSASTPCSPKRRKRPASLDEPPTPFKK